MVLVGVKGILVVGATVDLGLGVVLLASAAARAKRPVLIGSATAAGACVLLATFGVQLDREELISGVYRYGETRLGEGVQILFYGDGKTASVAMIEHPERGVRISTNGKADAMLAPFNLPPSADETTAVLSGVLALAHHPQARVAANIGFGSGKTTHTMLGSEQLERLDTIEIEPYMFEAARGFGERVRRAYEDPRSHVYFEDAKTFFATRNAAYDVIVSEPSNPWVSGIASLFSTEFYAHVRKHLKPTGLLVQWIQGYEIDMTLLASVFKALSPHFSDYVVYSTNGADLLIIARREGAVPPLDENVLKQPGLAAELARIRVLTANDVLHRRLANKRVMQALMSVYPVPANSDYFPYLDQHAARARFLRKTALSDLTALQLHPLPLLEMLEARPRLNAGRTVTRDDLYAPAARAHDALRLLAATQGRGAMPEALSRDWSFAALMLEHCDPQADWAQWRNTVRIIASQTLSHMPREEAGRLIERLRSNPCIAKLPKLNARWLDLLHAVALRNAEAMGPLAEAVSQEDGAEGGAYLLQVAMVSALVQKQSEAALRLWNEHGRSTHGERWGMDITLLLAMAYHDAPQDTRVTQLTGGSE
jgi:hypothetical protein